MEADCRCPNDCSSGCMTFWTEEEKTMDFFFLRLCKTLMIKAPEFDRVYDGLSAKAVIRSVISQAIHTKSIPQIQQILESKRTKRIQRRQWLNAMPRTQTCTNNMQTICLCHPMPHLVLHPPNAMLHVAGVGDTLEPCQHQYHAETEQHRTIISQNRTLKNFNTQKYIEKLKNV